MESSYPDVTVDVIVPARNEEDCIGRCLESLTAQTGISFRITLVNDGSTDRTGPIAASFSGVQVINSTSPARGVMGKCNALIQGAANSHARWLLFTDADTVHSPASLAAAVREAEERGVDLLSYSPEQEVHSVAELALMPVIFADLVRAYPPERINNPSDPAVAANGQYILVRRNVYEALGGHGMVANKLLDDVELARLFKESGHKIWFRQGTGLVKTRMYRSFRAMCDGWTKNLVLLFPHTVGLAVIRFLEFIVVLASVALAGAFMNHGATQAGALFAILAVGVYVNLLVRIRRAHFPWKANFLALLGLPLFSWLLLRSHLHLNVLREVTWKGRVYVQSEPELPVETSFGKDERKL